MLINNQFSYEAVIKCNWKTMESSQSASKEWEDSDIGDNGGGMIF